MTPVIQNLKFPDRIPAFFRLPQPPIGAGHQVIDIRLFRIEEGGSRQFGFRAVADWKYVRAPEASPSFKAMSAQVIESGRKTRADFKFFLELVNRLRILSALPIHETEIEIIEPTQINACGIRGCGGWGYYYMNLTKALISLYRKETPGIILR